MTAAAPPPLGLGPALAPTAARLAAPRSPAGAAAATGPPRPAAGPLTPGLAPTRVATDGARAAAAKPTAGKAAGAAGGPRHAAATRFAITQTAARRPRPGPHSTDITDPALDRHGVRAGTGG